MNMRNKIAAVALGTTLALGGGLVFSQQADAQGDRMQQREERLQAKVDEGVITQERADEIRARMAERAERHEMRREARTERAEALAATLGTTAEDLVAELRAGASLAELAEAAGVDIDALIDQIEAERTAQINQAVADGVIDQTRADEKLDGLRDRITARVNGERPEHRRGFGPRFRPGGDN